MARLFYEFDAAFIVDGPTPADLVEKYTRLGLVDLRQSQ